VKRRERDGTATGTGYQETLKKVGPIMKTLKLTRRKRTAIHEAGHATLHVVLSLGCKQVTIESVGNAGGWATHGGEFPEGDEAEKLRLCAEGEFWLRHAVALYAGAEAVRRAGYKNWRDGAGSDDSVGSDIYVATDCINKITDDADSINLLYRLAKKRAAILVDYYWPEIEKLASALLDTPTLSGDKVNKIVLQSIAARTVPLVFW
jgi:hypothetical protein